MEQKRENPFLQTVGPLVRTPVHEQVLAPRVAVDVTIKQYVTALKGLSHHHFCGAIFWTLLHTRCYPLPIQIQATKRSSVISNNYPIRIKHWNYFENEVVS